MGQGCIRLSCWLRGFCGDPETTQVDARADTNRQKTDKKAPWLRTASKQLTEHREVEQEPAWSLDP